MYFLQFALWNIFKLLFFSNEKESDNWSGSSPSTSVLPCQYHSTSTP